MKKYIIIALLLLITVSLWNCEKDDLCAETTPTTPRVVIEFYDALNPDVPKAVSDLVIEEFGTSNKLVANESLPDTDSNRYLFNVNTILLPLRTNAELSKFNFILDSGSVDEKTDILTFNYTKEDIYVSRACGYKTTFELNVTDGFEKTTNWIQVGGIVNYSITDENEAHVKIYF